LSLTPEELYARLRALVEEMPDLVNGPLTNQIHEWLGRAGALIASMDGMEGIAFNVYAQGLLGNMRQYNANGIAQALYRALTKAELNSPASVKGTFIAAGHTFDAFTAVGNVLKRAKTDILIVDPYADETVLSDYVILAPEGVTVRLLTEANYKQSLKPAAERWVQQFATKRPLHVRLAPTKALHDREIFVDGTEAWNVGHSLKDLAKKSLTGLSLQEGDLGGRKIAAYQDIWNASTPL
jgi:hypothetical protein